MQQTIFLLIKKETSMDLKHFFYAIAICIAVSHAPQSGANTARSISYSEDAGVGAWLLQLLGGNRAAVKLRSNGEPPECYDAGARPVYRYARCEELDAKPAERPQCDPNGKNGLPYCRYLAPCTGRQCIEPDPGP
jgi:hypothetical protein